MIEYAVESLTPALQEEFTPLFEEHYETVGHRDPEATGPIWKLNPDWDMYYTIQELNCLHICTVRDNSKLVGYYVNHITTLPHYKQIKAAISDLFFLSKSYRRGIIGKGLFSFMETEVKKAGAQVIKVHHKVYYDISSLLERLGYFQIEHIYSKSLE
jgi:hypothetical protein